MIEHFRDLWTSLTSWAVGINLDWYDLLIAGIILVAAIALAVLFNKVSFFNGCCVFPS